MQETGHPLAYPLLLFQGMLTLPAKMSPAACKIVEESPEFASLGEYLGELLDNDCYQFTGAALQALATVYGVSIPKMRTSLEAEGLTLAAAPRVKEVRGFTSNCHNLMQSLQHHGGCGIDATTGRATTHRTL